MDNKNENIKDNSNDKQVHHGEDVTNKEVVDIIIYLKKEINFLSKALDSETNKMSSSINDSLTNFETKLSIFKTLLIKLEDREKTFINEFNAFSLLPTKVANSIANIVPQIAKEVEALHHTRINQVIEQLEGFQNELSKRAIEHREEIKIMTSQFTEEALEATSRGRRNFLYNFFIIASCSIALAITSSCIVTKYYPRFVEITGQGNVTVNDSNVKIIKLKEVKN